jgi:hypothetical protein
VAGERRHESRFDSRINIGGVLALISLLLAIWAASNRLEGRIMALETKVDALWSQYNDQR